MRKTDARKLDHKTLTAVRRRAVASVQEGHSPEIVAQTMGIARATMYGWLAKYRDGGWGSLDARKRGGRPPKLDGPAMQWIFRTVTMKNPLQMKSTYALWTAKMVRKVISDRFGVKLSKMSVCRLLARLGLTPQRPIWRAYQQKPEEVQRWLNKEYLTTVRTSWTKIAVTTSWTRNFETILSSDTVTRDFAVIAVDNYILQLGLFPSRVLTFDL